jgi:hypothetical protein
MDCDARGVFDQMLAMVSRREEEIALRQTHRFQVFAELEKPARAQQGRRREEHSPKDIQLTEVQDN